MEKKERLVQKGKTDAVIFQLHHIHRKVFFFLFHHIIGSEIARQFLVLTYVFLGEMRK